MYYLFVDESGDPGKPFKTDKKGKFLLDANGNKIPTGASRYYIISILPLTDLDIFLLEDVSLPLYRALLKLLAKHKVKIHYRVVNKETYKGTFEIQRDSKRYFHNVFDSYNVVKTIVRLCINEKLENCEVVLDRAERRATDGAYNFDSFNNYLRRKVNTKQIRRVHHITHVDSSYVNIMQLSDLVSGALRDDFVGKNKDLKKILIKQLVKVF